MYVAVSMIGSDDDVDNADDVVFRTLMSPVGRILPAITLFPCMPISFVFAVGRKFIKVPL